MRTDPVCGMSVSGEPRYATEYEGKRYYFCSETCLHKFEQTPQQYLQETVVHDHACCGDGHAHGHPSVNGAAVYTCPMHPEIEQPGPGSCPKCGMALEPKDVPASVTKTEYTCPMHPEVVQDHPGNCPKCGMALEPRNVAVEEEENAELRDMSRRFWVSTVLAIPVFLSAMGAELWHETIDSLIQPHTRQWLEMALATPVVLWGGWPFFVRGWQSLLTRNLNMFTLIALGVTVAWSYSMVAVALPGIFPDSVRMASGVVPVYFEAAAVITALVLLGQVLELRARSR